jgi:predicted dinucleotide-binding enzyme
MSLDAVHGAEVVVLAMPWSGARELVSSLASELTGRILIDCTNPLTRGPDGLALAFGHDSSGAEEIARLAPGAHVFKTLNQTGAENIVDAGSYHPRPAMFVAGDDADAKARVLELV